MFFQYVAHNPLPAAPPTAKLRVVAFLKGAMENGSSETICAWLELAVCRSDILSQISTAWTVDFEKVWCIRGRWDK